MGQWVSSNHNHADEYMGSSLPYVTGSIPVSDASAQEVEFPYVTRFVQVFNNGDTNGLRVGFTKFGIEGNETNGNNNYFVVPPNTASARLEVKCTKLFVAGDGGGTTCSLIAGYTNIPHDRFMNLTGSEGFEGIG